MFKEEIELGKEYWIANGCCVTRALALRFENIDYGHIGLVYRAVPYSHEEKAHYSNVYKTIEECKAALIEKYLRIIREIKSCFDYVGYPEDKEKYVYFRKPKKMRANKLTEFQNAKESLASALAVHNYLKDVKLEPSLDPNQNDSAIMRLFFIPESVKEQYKKETDHVLVHSYFTDFLCRAITEKKDELYARALEMAREDVIFAGQEAKKESEQFLAKVNTDLAEYV